MELQDTEKLEAACIFICTTYTRLTRRNNAQVDSYVCQISSLS